MDIGESSSSYANDTSDMSGDKNLSKNELWKTVVDLVETDKNHELKIQELEKSSKR